MKTSITKTLIEKGYEVSNFYNSGLELTRSENGYKVTATVGEETFEITVYDVDAREFVTSIDCKLETLTLDKVTNIIEIAEGCF